MIFKLLTAILRRANILLTVYQQEDMSTGRHTQAEILEAVNRILQGETQKFRIIIDQYSDSIFRICRSYLKDHEEAEDAAQEIFLRVFKSLGTFRLDRNFRTWLFAIVFNSLKSRYRKIKLLPTPDAAIDPVESVTSKSSLNPASIAADKERVLYAREAVSTLPASLRQVVILYYFEEMTVPEISEILGLGNENIKSKLHRSRKKLRQLLDKDSDERK